MPVFGFGFERLERVDCVQLAAAAKPIIDACIEIFGPHRCMFESNFPMTREFITYRDIWNSYKLAIEEYSPDEKADLLHNTAQRFYAISSDL
jgi:L-fuconolactonase